MEYIETPTPKVVAEAANYDPNHELLHRVPMHLMERYKMGVAKTVLGLCGKDWAPTFPVNMKKDRCPICFPTDRHKYAIAA